MVDSILLMVLFFHLFFFYFTCIFVDIESESSDKEVVLIGPDIKDRYDGTSDTDSVSLVVELFSELVNKDTKYIHCRKIYNLFVRTLETGKKNIGELF